MAGGVIEYVLSRTMSVALVAEYQTKMREKKLLEAKLHEFYELAEQESVYAVQFSIGRRAIAAKSLSFVITVQFQLQVPVEPGHRFRDGD